MMIQEFEQLINGLVVDDDYKIIEKVYTWHPAIKENGGKKQIAQLYTDFGMSVIRGMEKVADHMKKLAEEEQKLNEKFVILNKRRSMLSEGDTSLEEMIIKVRDAWNFSDSAETFEKEIKKLRTDDANGIVEIALKICGYSV